ncbi:hypothetical protein BJY04DRAFT_225063 [Aspergillus karnatakaensis]|uniref:DUF3632 domain-containing protein n=1 Tax=Aspergillus karnatakaensis TaxID=1810916 RepID=UPI003CCD74CA
MLETAMSELAVAKSRQPPLRLEHRPADFEDDRQDPHEGYFEDDGTISRSEAYDQLYQMLPEPPQTEDEEESLDLDELNVLLTSIIQQTPYWHAGQMKLVLLVRLLEKADRCSRLYTFRTHRKYGGLWEFVSWLCEIGDYYEEVHDNVPEHFNIVAFQARLASAGVLTEHSHRKVGVMRQALENPRLNDVEIRRAAIWILIDGKSIYEEMVLYPEIPASGWDAHLFHPGRLYTGPRFGLERWEFWQKRFYEMADQQIKKESVWENRSGEQRAPFEPSLESREMARRAADLMAALTRLVKW